MDRSNISAPSFSLDRRLAENAVAAIFLGIGDNAVKIGGDAHAQLYQEVSEQADSGTGIVFLDVALPGRASSLGGFILLDHEEKRVFVRARSSWDADVDQTDREVLCGTRDMIESLFDVAGFEAGRDAVSELSNVVRSTNEFSLSLVDPPGIVADQLSMHLFGC